MGPSVRGIFQRPFVPPETTFPSHDAPLVMAIGDLACGNLKNRSEVPKLMAALPAAPLATDSEVLEFVERRAPMSRGIGYIDAHSPTAVVLAPPATLWTRDKRLVIVDAKPGIVFLESSQ